MESYIDARNKIEQRDLTPNPLRVRLGDDRPQALLKKLHEIFPKILAAPRTEESGLDPIQYKYTKEKVDYDIQRRHTRYTYQLEKAAAWIDREAGHPGLIQELVELVRGAVRELLNKQGWHEPAGTLDQIHFLEQSNYEAKTAATFSAHQDEHLNVSLLPLTRARTIEPASHFIQAFFYPRYLSLRAPVRNSTAEPGTR